MDWHDAHRRTAFAGVTPRALDGDKAGWIELGEAIVTLARLVVDRCEASGFCSARPTLQDLCARLVESIDDQLDLAAWTVVEAATRRAVVAAR